MVNIMHLRTICIDFGFARTSFLDDNASKTKLAADSVAFIFSLLHGVAFCGAMYIAFETILNGQYDISVAGGPAQCAIGFTALYIIAEIANTILFFSNLEDREILAVIVANIGMVGMLCMVGCAIIAMLDYCKSSTHLPSTMLTLTEKLNLSSGAICGIAVGVIIGLLLLWAMSEIVADDAHGKEFLEKDSRLRNWACLEGASCYGVRLFC